MIAPRNAMSLPGPDRHVLVGQGAGPGEPRVDVDDLGAARLGLHHPLEPDRVALGHVRALDEDAVGVRQVLLEGGRAAAAEASPQTGDGGGVSNTGLVLDLDRAQRGEQLLDQVVLFVVQRRPAQAGEAQRAPGALAVDLPCQPCRRAAMTRSAIMSIAGRGRASSHSVPYGRRYSTWYSRRVAGGQLQAGRALGAQPAAADRRVRVTFDLGDLAVLDVDLLPAADRAVRADRLDHLVGGRRRGPDAAGRAALGRRAQAQLVPAGQLPVDRPPLDPGPCPCPSP